MGQSGEAREESIFPRIDFLWGKYDGCLLKMESW